MPRKIMARRLGTVAMLVTIAAVGACSPEGEPAPTPQEVHSKDRGIPGGPVGRHWYECSDKRPRLVDFKDRGLQIELRFKEDDQPITLSAPTQALQYIGDDMVAVFEGSQLHMTESDRRLECSMIQEPDGAR